MAAAEAAAAEVDNEANTILPPNIPNPLSKEKKNTHANHKQDVDRKRKKRTEKKKPRSNGSSTQISQST